MQFEQDKSNLEALVHWDTVKVWERSASQFSIVGVLVEKWIEVKKVVEKRKFLYSSWWWYQNRLKCPKVFFLRFARMALRRRYF